LAAASPDPRPVKAQNNDDFPDWGRPIRQIFTFVSFGG
jgi:hypothetical protein